MSQVAQKPKVTNEEAASLLEQVIAASGPHKTRAILNSYFDTPAVREQIEGALPRYMKGEADRLIKRALITFSRTPALHECTPASFIRCVVQAAEYGFAIDGVLCYAVPFNNKVEEPGKQVRWEKQCQFMPSYKGLVAVARKGGQIAEIYGDTVCTNDIWSYTRTLAGDVLEHVPPLGPRGDVIGCYVIVILPNGLRRAEVMNLEEINHVRQKSKASGNGPWVSDFSEMARKTVVKRALKMYADDPGLIDLLDSDDRAGATLEEAGIVPQIEQAPLPTASKADQLTAQLKSRQAAEQAAETPIELESVPHDQTETETQQSSPDTNHSESPNSSRRELTPEDITNDFDRCGKMADVLSVQKRLEGEAHGDPEKVRYIQAEADRRTIELQAKKGK